MAHREGAGAAMLPRARVDAGMPLPSTGRSPGGSSPYKQSGGLSPPKLSPGVRVPLGSQGVRVPLGCQGFRVPLENPHLWQDHWACSCLCLVFLLLLLSVVLFAVFEKMGQAENEGTLTFNGYNWN